MGIDDKMFLEVELNSLEENACSPKAPDESFRGLLIQAPTRVSFKKGEPVGDRGAFAAIPVCGYYHVDLPFPTKADNLIEAMLLGLLGGVIGAFSGWAAAMGIFGFQFGIEGIFPAENLMPTLLSYFTYVGEAIGIAALLSVAAAAYPALYAARLNPAEALRYEV